MAKRKRKEAGEIPNGVDTRKKAESMIGGAVRESGKEEQKDAGEGSHGEIPNGVDPRKKAESKIGGAVRERGKEKQKEAGEGSRGEIPNGVDPRKKAESKNGGAVRKSGKEEQKEAGEGAHGKTPNAVDPRKKPVSKNGGAVRKSGMEEQKEGYFHLGDPTFVDLGNGRMRCVESGHELLAKDQEAYGLSKACRLALIDDVVARQIPPFDMFEPHPTSKSQLVCKLTRDNVNKTEEHIWKHLTGKKFQTVLSLFRFAIV